jgi:hypothetical protein
MEEEDNYMGRRFKFTWSKEEKELLFSITRKLTRLIRGSEITKITFEFLTGNHELKVTITKHKYSLHTLKCRRREEGINGTTSDGVFICNKLPTELGTIGELLTKYSSEKVGKYLYKRFPNQSGSLYWYIEGRDEGEGELIYLGKERPLFIPEEDLRKAREKKALKLIKKSE